MGRTYSIEEMRNAYRILDGKPEGKSPFERLYVCGSILLKLTF